MPDAIDITDLSEYGPALAKYKADKAVANESGTETDLARVDAEWANTRMRLMQTKVGNDTSQRETNAALDKAKTDFPNVPDEIYAHLTDPQAILTAAQKVAERMGPAQTPTAGNETPPAPGEGETWGGSPGAAAGGGTPTPNEEDPQGVKDRLMPVVMQKGAGARLENAQVRKATLSPILERYEQGKVAR